MKQKLTDPCLHPCISNRHTNSKLRFDTDLAGVSKLKYSCLTHSKPLHGRNGDRRQDLHREAKAVSGIVSIALRPYSLRRGQSVQPTAHLYG